MEKIKNIKGLKAQKTMEKINNIIDAINNASVINICTINTKTDKRSNIKDFSFFYYNNNFHFDIDKKQVVLKYVNDPEFIYKIQKTQIKCINPKQLIKDKDDYAFLTNILRVHYPEYIKKGYYVT